MNAYAGSISKITLGFSAWALIAFLAMLIFYPQSPLLVVLGFIAGAACVLLFTCPYQLPDAIKQLSTYRIEMPEGYEQSDLLAVVGTQDQFLLRMSVYPPGEEKILYAANKHPNGLIWAVHRPGRHSDVIFAMDNVGMAGMKNTDDQGFITTQGRYVDRYEACEIAFQAGQLEGRTKHGALNKLFSEDLW